MRSKKKMFELLALKDKLERNNYYKQAKAISVYLFEVDYSSSY